MEIFIALIVTLLILKIAGMAVIFLIACVLGALSSRD
jgi:hypothetical protein